MNKQTHNTASGFTLVEIMIVVAIIALLAAIAVPGFLRARKRSQATTVLNNLRLIDSAKDQYAIEYNKVNGTPNGADLKGYFKPNSQLYNAAKAASSGSFGDPKLNGVSYGVNDFSTLPSVTANSAFSDVTDTSFWSPYSIY
jgi:prepilin-type N-terminal cleavage/methylation domain-containing protein